MILGEKRAYIISSIVLAIAASICLIFGIQVASKGFVTIGGHSLFRVVTGSMEPTISTGAVLLCKDTVIEEIAEGDLVCYRTEVPEIYGSIVTHRVRSVIRQNGAIFLETRGDANVASDPYYVRSDNLIGRVAWFSGRENFINDVLSFLSGKVGFLFCIVFPILLVSGMILQSSVKNLQEDMALVKKEIEQKRMDAELLPGYTTLTRGDYNAIYESLKKELLEELNGTESKEEN